MRCGWGFYFRGAFEAQAGNSPLQGQSKPPAKLVVLIIRKGVSKMNRDTKKILVEIVCVIVRNILNIWKREVLKKAR